MKHRMNSLSTSTKIEIAVLCGLLLTIIFSITSFSASCDEVRSGILRLHVLANSDSEEDQALKLEVRDAVLEAGEEAFGSATDIELAREEIESNFPALEAAAKKVIEANGYDYDVSIKLEDTYFETRTYDNVTLPAGIYNAVRVVIGEGEGKNWWCVMFPPLCLPAAQGDEVELDDVLSEDGVALVESEPRYEVRFKLIEWIESLRGNDKG